MVPNACERDNEISGFAITGRFWPAERRSVAREDTAQCSLILWYFPINLIYLYGEENIHSTSQENPHLLWNLKV
jgi:hypothetical protein